MSISRNRSNLVVAIFIPKNNEKDNLYRMGSSTQSS